MIALYAAAEFLTGSLMFSYWLGRAAKKDLRTVGDGNPGASNLWRAAGYRLGIAGVALDFLKGYLPLALLIRWGWVEGFGILPVAAAPILGHAFSPFLRGRGGKAMAVTFGVWSAVTSFEASLAYAAILALLAASARLITGGKPATSEADGFMAVLGMLLLGVYLTVRGFPAPLLALWIANTLLLAYTNRMKLVAFYRTVSLKYRH